MYLYIQESSPLVITMKQHEMYTEQQKKRKCLFRSSSITLRQNVLWTFVFQTVQSLHTPPVSKTANVKTRLTFIQSNIANLICVSFAVQYINKF